RAISASFCSQNVTALARPIASAREGGMLLAPGIERGARDADIAGKGHGGMTEGHVFDDGGAIAGAIGRRIVRRHGDLVGCPNALGYRRYTGPGGTPAAGHAS